MRKIGLPCWARFCSPAPQRRWKWPKQRLRRTKATPHPDLIDDLVAANRILSDQGVVDGFGHVSVRHDTGPARFLLARSMAPGLVIADDILSSISTAMRSSHAVARVYVERFIHSEIYKAHPDVRAVVHTAIRRRSFRSASPMCRCGRSTT